MDSNPPDERVYETGVQLKKGDEVCKIFSSPSVMLHKTFGAKTCVRQSHVKTVHKLTLALFKVLNRHSQSIFCLT